MDDNTEEFTLKLRSKIGIVFLFAFVGLPMLYAGYLNFKIQEVVFGLLMVGLFLAWAMVILMVMGFKIKISDTAIQREGLLTPSVLDFDDIETIHFGSTWSDFHVQADGTKIFISKDFENYEQIIQRVINKLKSMDRLEKIDFEGEDEQITQYTSEKE
jgi:hypothetical protein